MAQAGAGVAYAYAGQHRRALLLVIPCLALNWFGDSLDGTLARLRKLERPRYGFYVDHVVDLFGSIALMAGLACSGLVHPGIAAAMLVGFLLLAGESFLATYTLGRFEMSQGMLGPTELRLLLAAANLAALRNPWAHVHGHRLLLFDVGGAIGSCGMFAMALVVAGQHTRQLYRAAQREQQAGE